MSFGIDDAIAAGLRIVDKIIPDPAAKAAAAMEAIKLKQAGEFKDIDADLSAMQMQADINKVEASSSSLFVAGWRPFAGWVGGASLAYVSILEPLMRFYAQVFSHYTGPFPVIDTTITVQVLLGMLGLAGMRSIEKLKGAA